MQFVQTPHAPTAAGHYSQGVVHGGVVYVAGQVPLDPASGALVGEGDVAAQTEQALRNVAAVLAAAGSGLDRVLSMTVFVTDAAFWPEVNATYARVMGAHRPARAIIPIAPLKGGFLIEIQAVAAVA